MPTTPTTSSVIAGIQVQEAVKMLHGLPTIAGQGFVFDGTNHQSYLVTLLALEDCPSHDAMAPIEELPWSVAETTAGAVAGAGALAILGRRRWSKSITICWRR